MLHSVLVELEGSLAKQDKKARTSSSIKLNSLKYFVHTYFFGMQWRKTPKWKESAPTWIDQSLQSLVFEASAHGLNIYITGPLFLLTLLTTTLQHSHMWNWQLLVCHYIVKPLVLNSNESQLAVFPNFQLYKKESWSSYPQKATKASY